MNVSGVPNKKKDSEFIYSYQGEQTVKGVEDIIKFLKEFYPLNKKKAKGEV